MSIRHKLTSSNQKILLTKVITYVMKKMLLTKVVAYDSMINKNLEVAPGPPVGCAQAVVS